ncbi:MAG: zf-HC2 domain-containing protein [Acidobacteriota bacterium]
MNPQIAAKVCPKSEIAAYIDGELSPREELDLEMHFASCHSCAAELNEQKKLLCALDFALEDEREIRLPENFTKVIVATAESSVSGLRRPQERIKAFFICAALTLLVLLGLGSETGTVVSTFWEIGDQILAVSGFAFHLIYDISIGTAIILRSVSRHIAFNSIVWVVFLIGILFIGLVTFSRLIVRFNRA